MCLIIKFDSVRQKASEDIICYKVVRNIFTDFQPDYRTYYQYSAIEIGKRYNSELSKSSKMKGCLEVEIGLHTFVNLEDAKAFAVERMHIRKTNLNVIKCHIPKGGSYYEGLFDPWGKDNGVESYASTALIYDELVEL